MTAVKSNAKATIAQATATAKSTINKAKSKVEQAIEPAQDKVQFSFAEFQAALRERIAVSWKRELVAHLAAFGVAALGGYIGGMLLNAAFVAVATLTGSLFLAWFVFVVGAIAVIYGSVKLSQKIGGYIATGNIDADIVAAKNKFTSFFAKKPLVAA